MSADALPLHDRLHEVDRIAVDDERLLTIAVPADRSVATVHERVEEDHAEVSYIDTDGVSSHEVDALEHARRVLAEYDETPPNGLVDGDVEVVEEFDSDVMGKTRAGGQSAERFERERERQRDEFFEAVAETAERAFLDRTTAERATEDVETTVGSDAAASDGDGGVDGLLVGGTTGTVERFVDDDHLPSLLRDRMLGDPFAVEYANETGLGRLAELGADRIERVERRGPREALDDMFDAVATDDDVVTYGRDAVDDALTYEAVETLLLAESLRPEVFRALERRASEQGGETVVVPTDIEDGQRFAEGFDGRAAFLRFPVE